MTRLARARIRRLGGLAAGLAVLATACASDAPQDSLDPAGPDARTIDNLFGPVMVAALVVFVVVQGLVIYAVLKYRRRADDVEGPDEVPAQVHGNTRLEIGWTILPALILAVVAIFTVPVIFDLTEEPEDALTVDVVGQRYWWAYRYPEQEQMDGPAFTTANELHIPAGEEIFLRLRSEDVIHSFWAPRLNGKRDVVPGREHTWKLQADDPGVYSGQCAEFCGTSHANMRLKVVAHDEAEWQDWLDGQQQEAEEPTEELAATGFELFGSRCATCHQVDGSWEQVAEESPPAPNLTHLFSRDCFAGCIYDLNRNELEAWLRDPQRKAGSLMVIGQLSETEIDQLYAYLRTLE
ncbi:MAG: Cytochrome c oxidase polypeptide [Acidimicrobiales bacterium]|nr:Cytochrome c oxidase polypeptide [Acidimicrobiales bacterium]